MNSDQQQDLYGRLDSLEGRMKEVEKGFPNQDYAGHARYHQAIIDEFLEKKKLRSAVVEQIVKGSVWSLLAAAAVSGWTYFKDHVLK